MLLILFCHLYTYIDSFIASLPNHLILNSSYQTGCIDMDMVTTGISHKMKLDNRALRSKGLNIHE